MPSTRPKPPGGYPAGWEAAMKFLALRTNGQEIALEVHLTRPQIHTQHAKARGMRKSMQEHPAWATWAREFATSGRLNFRRELRADGWALLAYTDAPLRKLKDILNDGLAD